jgi:hypothetical protein
VSRNDLLLDSIKCHLPHIRIYTSSHNVIIVLLNVYMVIRQSCDLTIKGKGMQRFRDVRVTYPFENVCVPKG